MLAKQIVAIAPLLALALAATSGQSQTTLATSTRQRTTDAATAGVAATTGNGNDSPHTTADGTATATGTTAGTATAGALQPTNTNVKAVAVMAGGYTDDNQCSGKTIDANTGIADDGCFDTTEPLTDFKFATTQGGGNVVVTLYEEKGCKRDGGAKFAQFGPVKPGCYNVAQMAKNNTNLSSGVPSQYSSVGMAYENPGIL